MKTLKRQNGRFYTEGDPFALSPFNLWADDIGLRNRTILEPFAGSNNIVRLLQKNNFANEFCSFDIKPANKSVKKRNTIKNFPTEFDVIVTNPPWLAKNSAKRRGLSFPQTTYDDLYKHCLNLCLENASYVGALIPASFLRSGLFRDRLHTFIMLHDRNMFLDTDNPVGLALFNRESKEAKIYYDNKHIGNLPELEKHLPGTNCREKVKFNCPNGKLGFIAFDNTKAPTIRFCKGSELDGYEIKHTTRMITKIDVPSLRRSMDDFVNKLNAELKIFREETKDVFLTPFKGLRQDGMYRRRMEYSLAKNFILKHA